MIHKTLGIIIICVLFLLPFNVHSSELKEDNELQVKCEKQCKEFFEKEYGNGTLKFPESTDIYSYKNYYNKKMDKCFILLEANVHPKDPEKSMIIFRKLLDMTENKIQGIYVSGKAGTSCYLSGTDYKDCSNQKWNDLLKPYMEE